MKSGGLASGPSARSRLAVDLFCGATVTFAKWYLAQDARLGVSISQSHAGGRASASSPATSLLHLFQFEGANDVYTDLVKQDPECAMGYWGIAMSKLRDPLYLLPNDDDVNIARRALTATEAARHKQPRERAYIAAARKLFPATGIPGFNERLIAYAQAMEAAVTKFPEDREATVFFALALNFAAPPSDSISRERTRATELLRLQVSASRPQTTLASSTISPIAWDTRVPTETVREIHHDQSRTAHCIRGVCFFCSARTWDIRRIHGRLSARRQNGLVSADRSY